MLLLLGAACAFDVLTPRAAPRIVAVHDLWDQQVPYAEALDWQRHLLKERTTHATDADHPEDALLVMQHPPVLTLGTSSTLDNLRSRDELPFDLFRTERGGEVTYHGPGQLVCYPLLNLRAYRQDAHWYMRALEEVAMRTVSTLGLVPAREPGLTGVWVGGGKLCAIGVKLSRWVTMHGLALNVHPDLAHFEHIVPCGIADRPVTSVADELRRCGLAMASLEEVHTILLGHFADVFDVQLKVVDQTPAALHRDAGRPIDSLARDG